MGKLRKLRTRFISSIGAVRRSVLRRQSQSNASSTAASNPTTLTRLASLDSAVPTSTGEAASAGRQAQKRELQVRLQAGSGQEDLQLHWNEARRIYSEPVQVTQSTLSREGNSVATGTTEADCNTLSSAAGQEQLVGSNTSVGGADSLCGSTHAGSQVSDEEDYDDVFLQSWEETGW